MCGVTYQCLAVEMVIMCRGIQGSVSLIPSRILEASAFRRYDSNSSNIDCIEVAEQGANRVNAGAQISHAHPLRIQCCGV